MNAPLPAFQQFQMAFGRHLRDPRRSARPQGVPARRAALYGELLFNNITGFLDSCFPVCRGTLGDSRWRRLNRAFFRDWRCQTPWFREIPREFVSYLQQDGLRQPLPAWFAALAHYEWAELAVDVMDLPMPVVDRAGDLLDGRPLLNPVLMNLAYAWPVQRIGPDYRPRRPVATNLLVFRDGDDVVRFSAINPVTARLVALLAAASLTGREACLRIAGELQHPAPEAIVTHGGGLLAELRTQGVILGVTP